MKRPRLRLRRRGADEKKTDETLVAPTQASGAPGKPEWPAAAPAAAKDGEESRQPDAGAGEKDIKAGDGAAASDAAPERPVDPHERIDGLRAWLADAERKFAIRTYAIGAATVLALAASIVAVVLVLNLRDEAATTEELRAVQDQIGIVREEAETAVDEQMADLSERVETLERRISRLADDQTGIDRELQALQDDIDDVREQLLDVEDELGQVAQDAAAGGGGGGGAGADDDLP